MRICYARRLNIIIIIKDVVFQVISLLRRIISEIPPQKMLAAINPGSEISER